MASSSSSAEYIPKKEMEDLTVIDVLKIADGTIKLVDQLDLVFKDRMSSVPSTPAQELAEALAPQFCFLRNSYLRIDEEEELYR